jgi:mRNA interferase RelE/StbE
VRRPRPLALAPAASRHGADAEVYAEATARVQAASGQRPEIRKLAEVIEPVPNWLAARLIDTVGMTPQDVAALSLEEAVDRCGDFMSKPR